MRPDTGGGSVRFRRRVFYAQVAFCLIVGYNRYKSKKFTLWKYA